MDKTLADYLIESSKIFKDKIAVRHKNDFITYSALDEFSGMIARGLIKKGFKRADRIGIYMDKSINAVAAIFGIVKAGCVYIPLDTKQPFIRARNIIKDSRMEGLFIEDNGAGKPAELIGPDSAVKYIFNLSFSRGEKDLSGLEAEYVSREDMEAMPGDRRENRIYVSRDDLAYILYTSGSTGKPKGVMLTHKNAMTFVDWAVDYLRITDKDVLSNHAPFHFDLSVFDIYAALKTGAELCIVPEGMSCFPVSLADFIEKNRITVWYSVPAAIIHMLARGNMEKKDFSSLRVVLYAGEVFPYRYLNRLREILNKTEIINLYGLTETNVITFYNLSGVSRGLSEDVPIGMPCPYAEIYILNNNNEPAGENEEGELVVAGDSVMSGYWKDEEKTRGVMREAGINGPEKIFFFTGDMAARKRDGMIIYRGRRDNIKKIRGYRVDLGEVQSALYKSEDIEECAVACVPDDIGGGRIKAVLVLRENSDADEERIKRFCAGHVPAYMIPEIIEFRKELPRVPTGKIGMALL